MELPTIRLINGPYNNCEMDDLGFAVIRMAIYDGGPRLGSKTGIALYLPDRAQGLAFWDGNVWLGELVAVVGDNAIVVSADEIHPATQLLRPPARPKGILRRFVKRIQKLLARIP